jgi:ligand-binding sensor protein
MPEKTLSEAAQAFLKEFQRTLNDFAQQTGFQVFLLDKEGGLITEMEGVQEVCKLILSQEEGRIRCRDCLKIGLSLVRNQKQPIFAECYAGFVLSWLPIIVREALIGLIVVCGGKQEKGEREEKLREKFSKLADELGIFEKDRFLKLAMERTKLVNENEMKKDVEKLKKLIDILVENVQTPLKEIFG